MSEQSQDDSGLTARVGGGPPQAPADDESVTEVSHGSQSEGDGGSSGGQGAAQVASERASGETFGDIDTLDD